MRKKTFILTVAILGAISILLSCSKDSVKQNNVHFAEKDASQYTGVDILIAYNDLSTYYGPQFNFSFDDFTQMVEDSTSAIVGNDVILEDLMIIDDSMRRTDWPAFIKISLYNTIAEEGDNYFIQLDKSFGIFDNPDATHSDTTIFYTLPGDDGNGGNNGGGNNGGTTITRTFTCKNKGCPETCQYDFQTDAQGHVTIFLCDCPILDMHDKCKAHEIGAFGLFFARIFGSSSPLIQIGGKN